MKLVKVYDETHKLIFDVARLLSMEEQKRVSGAEAIGRRAIDNILNTDYPRV